MATEQEIYENHSLDVNGNPSGGLSNTHGMAIEWQTGPVDGAPNGATVEGVIKAAIGRLNFYQTASNGKFANEYNEDAISSLEEALAHLRARTADREARGVEGKNEP